MNIKLFLKSMPVIFKYLRINKIVYNLYPIALSEFIKIYNLFLNRDKIDFLVKEFYSKLGPYI